ncbi:glycosyl hydrolase 115 family protein [Algoriphagus sp. D3-2-R+10]|uniref:glycosyl hydrolase 115 family protein n=1 Tax=Algoriphagus aurantiacus TaxID=3103948 RepID=UPI002B3CAF1C|nr:glycosyl hydrolase 115 family protein [Algoriphagus sp. D3-2-R+10]MEB2774672.1 glycosyl hydrolase 115 family protein [Algoriphagus sp. D3-2-R+10]
MKLATISKYLLIIWVSMFLTSNMSFAQNKEPFIITSPQITSQIVLDNEEAPVVHTAAAIFAQDVFSVSGQLPEIVHNSVAKYQIKAGTFGVNSSFDLESRESGIDVDVLKSKWEGYCIKGNVDAGNGNKTLYVVGSNPRGTAYGLLEISRMIGVSPWVWWADVSPEKKEILELPEDFFVEGAPKVKYRGIFLNDEDWGLQPWAAKTFEPDIRDIGPKTYEKIFQLLLRLRANAIWPAMHPSTKAFYTIPGNKEMAAKYQVFVGTSHAEPMLRNNVGEWNKNRYGEYNYATNRDAVKQYWKERIDELDEEDRYIVTLGMRGIHDSGMQGNFSKEERVEMLETIISDQREMLKNTLKKDVMDIPQAFVPYKEVLEVYSDGAKVPDDVTLVWPDDNHGYIRQLSNADERKRSGGAGVYYHISYWGRPHDYLWLESVPVSLIWEEMNKAYQSDAKDIWIVNVGDIKPNEIGMDFFLEMAWNPDQFSPENLSSYYTRFAARQFGDAYAEEIGEILTDYFQLGFSRKPEHMGWTGVYPNTPIQDPEFSLLNNGDEVQQRIDAYNKLEEQVEVLQKELPEYLKDAFYQLVAYKVLGASNMNKKLLYAYKSRVYTQQGRVSANLYAEKAKEAYGQIQEITTRYNRQNNGKWMHMMDYNPRELPVFDMPEVGRFKPTQKTAGGIIPEGISQPIEPEDTKVSLPTFLSSTDRQYFIDVFNAGHEPLKWMAQAKDPWVQISSTSGKTSTDERIWVSMDWSLIPVGRRETSSIKLKVGKAVYNVQVEAQKPDLQDGQQLFVEDNGVISIEAEHFNKAQNDEDNQWKLIQGLGRQNDAVGTFPITASPFEVFNERAPSLSYEFFTMSSGEVNLRFYCLPSQPINSDYKLRFAVSIDDGKPIVVDASLKEVMDEHNEEWSMNVLKAANIAETKVIIPQTGRHRLKITMIDPGVVFDKIEMVMNKEGEKVDSYFGSKEIPGVE